MNFFDFGRIAQLVELLSYTQVVIGSSPVAPKPSLQATIAGVVQLVRALPCHGRSCGFEPRLPRISFAMRQLQNSTTVEIEDFEPHCVGHCQSVSLPVRRVDGDLPERVGEEARTRVGFERAILRVEEFYN